jgi:glycosyltransferase XagB
VRGGIVFVSKAYQSFVGDETPKLCVGKDSAGPELPELPNSYLPQIFSRFSNNDCQMALREKIIPVAVLPHLTLYGAAGDHARLLADARGLRVVAQIKPQDFRATVRSYLGRDLLHVATHGLKNKSPQLSAHRRFSSGQSIWVIAISTILIFAMLFVPTQYLYVVFSLFIGLFFLAVISLRIFSILDLAAPKPVAFCKLYDDELPIYSVLVPVFREVGVLDQLIGALLRLDYPIDKLDIKIILEETDVNMQRTVARRKMPSHFDVIIVPSGTPQTKPRALNYAMQFARGELVTIFDAEDIPEPMQLRRAAEQFASSEETLACLQAELAFYNPNENWLTRQFTLEYATLFKTMLPSLAKSGLPMLLGGTSNHFRISVLRDIGGWDPFNVTEDADLGLRLARMGYSSAMLDSVTYEEANTELRNWLQQRARWLKGFLQTWLVHMREPQKTVREIGWGGFWVMNAMTLGIIVSALFHPFLIGFAMYQLLSGQIFENDVSLMMQFLAALNLVVLAGGYGVAIYAGGKAIKIMGIRGWWFSLMTMPFYWALMTIAGWMALWQFIVRPFHWNKTRHGLSAFQKSHAPN